MFPTTTGVDWFKATALVPTKTRRGRNSTVIYPIFAECASISSDQYWTDVLNKASIGKLPKKFFYDDGKLIYKKNKKVDILQISPDINTALIEIVNFIKYHTGLISDTERDYLEQNQIIQDENINYWESWKELKSPARAFLIANYIFRLRSVLNLNKFEEAQLRAVINYGINCKKFDCHNIILVDSEIDKIDGLLFDHKKRMFSIDPSITVKAVSRSRSRKSQSDNTTSNEIFGKKWRAFIDTYFQRIMTLNTIKCGIKCQVPNNSIDDKSISSTKQVQLKLNIKPASSS
jgi:hypothetical protein